MLLPSFRILTSPPPALAFWPQGPPSEESSAWSGCRGPAASCRGPLQHLTLIHQSETQFTCLNWWQGRFYWISMFHRTRKLTPNKTQLVLEVSTPLMFLRGTFECWFFLTSAGLGFRGRLPVTPRGAGSWGSSDIRVSSCREIMMEGIQLAVPKIDQTHE